MYKNRLFVIKTLSNTHVGSGEQNFGIVDNLVQRDEISSLPCIHSSSLKGALRDHFENLEFSKIAFSTIFGDSDGAGEFKFLQADLLAMPVRSNKRSYYLATTIEIVERLIEYTKDLNINMKITLPSKDDVKDNIAYVNENDKELEIEDFTTQNMDGLEKLAEFLDYEHIAIFSEKSFKAITQSLPIITRNKVAKHADDDNNLFYEEVIPRATLFSFVISEPTVADTGKEEEKELQNSFDKFFETLISDTIQIGGNASIGYGLTKISEYVGVKK